MSDNSKPHLLSHFPEAKNQNSNISCQTDEDQSISGLNKRSCSFVWKIKNFKDRPEQKGEFVSSKVFRIKQWHK